MKHDIHLEGYAYALRPVELEDAEFIVELRTPERTAFMQPITRTIEAQIKYLEQQLQRPNEYYFVIHRMRDQQREGLGCLLDVNTTLHSAQWGRLVLRPGSFASAETALLFCRLAFDILHLNEVWGFTTTENLPMIAYSESCGFERSGMMDVIVGGKPRSAIRFVMTKQRWQNSEKKLRELSTHIAQLVQREY
jgi:RimJ/RimL family protein N-acetyltransferase